MSRHAGIVLAGGFVVAPGPCLLWIVRMLMLFVVLKNGGGAEIVSLRESQSQVIRENRGIILWGWGNFHTYRWDLLLEGRLLFLDTRMST